MDFGCPEENKVQVQRSLAAMDTNKNATNSHDSGGQLKCTVDTPSVSHGQVQRYKATLQPARGDKGTRKGGGAAEASKKRVCVLLAYGRQIFRLCGLVGVFWGESKKRQKEPTWQAGCRVFSPPAPRQLQPVLARPCEGWKRSNEKEGQNKKDQKKRKQRRDKLPTNGTRGIKKASK